MYRMGDGCTKRHILGNKNRKGKKKKNEIMLNVPTYISNPSYPTKKKTKEDIIKNHKRNSPQL